MTRNKKAELKLEEQAFSKYMKDPRAFWESVGFAVLQRPAQYPIPEHNKDGDETTNSQIERLSYENLKKSLRTINDDIEGTREPTELEMIIACQAQHARHSTPAAVFIRDTLGAKPIEKQDIAASVTDYSQLSDDELKMLAEYRAQEEKNTEMSCVEPENLPTSELIPVDMPENEADEVKEATDEVQKDGHD